MGVFRPEWHQPQRPRIVWTSAVVPVDVTITAEPAIAGAYGHTGRMAGEWIFPGPAIAGAYGHTATVSTPLSIEVRPAIAGGYSPGASVAAEDFDSVVNAAPGLAGAVLIGGGGTFQEYLEAIPEPAIAGAYGPEANVVANDVTVGAVPGVAGAFAPEPAIAGANNSIIDAAPGKAGAILLVAGAAAAPLVIVKRLRSIFYRFPTPAPGRLILVPTGNGQPIGFRRTDGWEKVSSPFIMEQGTHDRVMALVTAEWASFFNATAATLANAVNQRLQDAGYRGSGGVDLA